VALQVAEAIDRLPLGPEVLASSGANAIYRRVMQSAAAPRVARIARRLRDVGVDARVTSHNHHDCHLASAYMTSGDAECLVVSNDGFGDGECSKVAVGRNGRLTVVSRNPFFNSLGVYYNYVTQFCGFPKAHHAGKTTGLAALGDPGKTLPIFQSLISWNAARGIYENKGRLFRNCLRELYAPLDRASPQHPAPGIHRHSQ